MEFFDTPVNRKFEERFAQELSERCEFGEVCEHPTVHSGMVQNAEDSKEFKFLYNVEACLACPLAQNGEAWFHQVADEVMQTMLKENRSPGHTQDSE